MRERFFLDPKENILFIDFAGLRIESRAQVEEMARIVEESVSRHGRRVYAVVNYEGAEVAPDIAEFYGERIRELQARHAVSTVRYSSSGLTRSVLRYLGAAVDLESNAFTIREEAIRAIRESERRAPTREPLPLWRMLHPRRSLLGKLSLAWLAGLAAAALVYAAGSALVGDAAAPQPLGLLATLAAVLVGAAASGVVLYLYVIRPLGRMESLARSLLLGGAFEPVEAEGEDETARLARVLNETAGHVRRDIERLSGLYHISLMMGTGTELSRLCELLTRKTARLLGAEMCAIMLCDEQRQRLYAQLPAYGVGDDDARLLSTGLDAPTIAARVFHGGEPYMANEVSSDALWGSQDGRGQNSPGVRAVLAVPLRAGEQSLGTLLVMNKGGGFVEEDKQLVTIFASQAAHLVAGAQLFERVRRAEQMAAVGEMVAGVAHEVRNPLCGITTTLSALARRLEDREEVRPFVDVIMAEAGHLNHLMEQLLEHGRPARPDATRADVGQLIREVVGEWGAQARARGIALDFECAGDLPGLALDRRKMHGVFVNLIDNALQHTPEGGRVRVSVAPPGTTREVRIEVSDTGAGIPPDKLPRIFDPFYTTRTAGTGLGLAIVQKTIHDHGGTITARSEPGLGTAFVISLPLWP